MPNQEFEYDVFLSYTEPNKAEARNLYERLRNEAIRVFFAEETILAGIEDKIEVSAKLRKAMSSRISIGGQLTSWRKIVRKRVRSDWSY